MFLILLTFSKDDWLSVERTLSWLQEDGISPTFNMCVSSLECLGGLLHRSIHGKSISRALSIKISTEGRLLHSFVENKILDIIALAEKHVCGYSLVIFVHQ